MTAASGTALPAGAGRAVADAIAADAGRPRSTAALAALATLAVAGVVALSALGAWQLERRAWKLDLIERVEARIHADPVAAPGPAAWPRITGDDAYRRVRLEGRFRNDDETLVRAVTALGGGYWVMTPLVADAGFTVLVNRGFVPESARDPATRAAGRVDGETAVTGLLRTSEPGGGFLRANDPAAGRWYSRDVVAIAAASGLSEVAPYFVDAEPTAADAGGAAPVGGLTVVSFPNNHLVYALTWLALALMLAGATGVVAREEWRRRRR